MKREPTLADQYLARKTRFGWEPPNDLLRRARRFVLDTEASALVGQLIRDIAPQFLAQHEFARAPYDLCWVEFDQRAYFKALETGFGPNVQSDNRVGHLIHDNHLWTIAENELYGVRCMPVSYMLRSPMDTGLASRLENVAAPAIEVTTGTTKMTKFAYENLIMGSDPGYEDNRALYREVALAHRCIIAPQFSATDMEMVQLLGHQAGDLKRALAVCLLMGMPGKTVFLQQDVGRTHGLVRGRRVSYLEHHNLTLHISRPEAIIRVRKGIKGIKHRRHEVRGHWCQTRTLATEQCAHEWNRLSSRLYQCAKCSGKRWWKQAHERGDAGIGFVTKEYEVVP